MPRERKSLVSEHASLRVICRDDMNTVCCPSDWDFNKAPLYRLKIPTSLLVGSSCKNAGVYDVHLR